MNKEAIEQLLENNPALRTRRDAIEAMVPGAYCLHASWGFGQIKSYDAAGNRLIIDFDTKPGHPMAPEFCVDKLRILAADNILVRQRVEPKKIEDLVKNDRTGLIKAILSSAPTRTMSIVELETTLIKLLGPVKMKKWWSEAKKEVARDPAIAAPAKKEGAYVLRAEGEEVKPEAEILEEYYLNKNPRKKIELAEKLFNSSLKELDSASDKSEKVKHIEKDLHNIFDELTHALQNAKTLRKAEILRGVWVRNDLCRHFKEEVETLEPTRSAILLSCSKDELNEVAQEIPQSPAYLKRLLSNIKEVYPEATQWQEVVVELLRKSTGKFTAECVNFLVENDCTKLVASKLSDWLDSQSLESSVLIWVAKNRDSKKYAKIVKPLITHRLLAAILYAIDREALASNTNRRIPLGEVLSEDSELISDLLDDANFEIARDLAQSLLLNQGFEPLTKKSLLARFIKLYPKIQGLIDKEANAEASEQLVVSKASYEKFQKELSDIIKVKLPAIKEAINIAKEHGDLKENSEYKMAKQDQTTTMARKAQLEGDLARARVTDFTDASKDVISVGSVVELLQSGAKKPTGYSILGAWDSNPDENILSYKTPLAQKLLGRKAGDTVETDIGGNKETWTVKSIARWVDSK